MKRFLIIAVLFVICSAFTTFNYYPIDGYAHTGIKRLKRLELIKSGELPDATKLPEGALKSYMDITLNLTTKKEDSVGSFLVVDEAFQQELSGLFKGLDKSYSISVLDISDLYSLRYAKRN